ncbi:MAG TPA: glycosyl hydrolase family 18 protein [Polyangiaceae bacterium]
MREGTKPEAGRARAWRAFSVAALAAAAAACGSSGTSDAGEAGTKDAGTTPPPSVDAGAGGDGTAPDAGQGGVTGDGSSSTPEAGAIDASPVEGGTTSDGGGPADAAALGKIVGGYYPNWTPSPVRIKDIDPHYNLIYLFAATPVGGAPGTTGAITWSPPGDGLGAATNLNADLAYARQTQGRKIILSVGGANNGMSFPDRTKSQTFVSSVGDLYTQLGGFDGLDWNTFEGSQAPDTSEMIWISQTLKATFPGFLITAPPAPWNTVDQTFCAQMVAAGALDYAAPQYYDGPNLATQTYLVPNVDTWVGLVGEDRLVVGFGIWDQPNYWAIGDAVTAWKAVASNHPGLRGVFDWQVDVDQASGWPFAQQLGPLVGP